jgi:hypothetical protein
MTEWLYRATPTKVGFEATRGLALEDGLICRSGFEDDGSHADNTKHVAHRDLIHFYFCGEGSPQIIGTFEVVGPNRHPRPKLFGKSVVKTALLEIGDEVLTAKLGSIHPGNGEGYEPDPVLRKFTGWAVVARPDVETPPFNPAAFPNQASLVRARR